MKTAVIIAAGGSGQRAGLAYPKQLYMLGGKTVIEHSVGVFHACTAVDQIIIVCHKDYIEVMGNLADRYSKVCAVVQGGGTRQKSVSEGLRVLPEGTGLVLIHDAARPFADDSLIRRVIAGTLREGACVPVIRPVDSVKLLDGDFIGGSVSRESVALVQTPQGFLADGLISLYNEAERENISFGDDSGLYLQAGRKVLAVRGDLDNIKITSPRDLLIAGEIFGRKVNEVSQ